MTPRQLEILDFLKRYQMKNSLAPTISEIQKHFGFRSPSTVHEQLSALEDSGFIRRSKHVQRGIEILPTSAPAEGFEIPLLGVVVAGYPIEAILTRETITVPPDLYGPQRFALRVRGDSMVDVNIADKDTIIVDPVKTAYNGQTVVALIDGQEATVKKFYQEKGSIRLQPANDNFKPIIIRSPNRVQIQGRVVGLIRNYK